MEVISNKTKECRVSNESLSNYEIKDGSPFKNVLRNIDSIEDDVTLEYNDNRDLIIVFPRSTRKELRHLPFYKRIKKYIKLK